MASRYLSPEASAERFKALYRRLSQEAINLGPGGITWLPESDYWLLPERVRGEVDSWIMKQQENQTCDFHS